MRQAIHQSTPIAFTLFFLVFSSAGPTMASQAHHPNIVIILADDFGVGDIQAHYPENKIATPFLDDLVRQSVSFTDAHSPSAVCSPTRYGLLTGRYAWRTRLQKWVLAAYEPPLIDAERPTLPGFLRHHGYRTACVGKWHLGWQWPGPQPSRMTRVPNGQKDLHWDFTKPIRGGPTERGFDYYFGDDVPNFAPFTFIENDRVVVQPTERYVVDPNEGVVLPSEFSGCPMAPGWKLGQVLPEITKRAVQRIRQWASDDKPFFLFFSMTSPHEPVVPSDDFRGKSGIAPIADYVMQTDWSAGQVIQALEDAGVADNTIVIFTADNGHSHYTGWEHLIEAGHMPSGPYRGHKGQIWEGGHRVPLIIRWPGRIAAGTISDQLVSLTDFFGTCADILEVDLPDNGAEDSISFLPIILGKSAAHKRTTLVNHSNFGEFAYRDGDWKLVYKQPEKQQENSQNGRTVAMLFNLSSDVAEQKDLAKEHPELVARLTAQLEAVIARGTSRELGNCANDTLVQFQTTQKPRWGGFSE